MNHKPFSCQELNYLTSLIVTLYTMHLYIVYLYSLNSLFLYTLLVLLYVDICLFSKYVSLNSAFAFSPCRFIMGEINKTAGLWKVGVCCLQIINSSGQRLHVNVDNRQFIVCFDLRVFIGDHTFFCHKPGYLTEGYFIKPWKQKNRTFIHDSQFYPSMRQNPIQPK